uniref:Circadian input-output histidine kinase CikA n=1 Tax=Cyanothece sp. (strain PCC 7425 / ATCC 29141) TaxID=395961 RepID=B8HWK7_CYAP4
MASPDRTILVIDVLPGSAAPYQCLLQPAAEGLYRVITESYNGPILALCRSARVDAILLESRFPDPQGLDVLDQLKAQLGEQCPPIIVIDQNDANLAKRALKAGAVDYLIRSQITSEILYQAVSMVISTDGKSHDAERPKTEAALRESEARLQAVTNLVPDLLWDSEPDGSTNWYNQRWMEYTGQTFEQAIGWGWIDAIHPDDREGSARRYREAVEQGVPLQQEHRIRRHDGAYRWFGVKASPLKDGSGKVVKMYGAATDIHEQWVALEALRESEEKFRTLANTAPALIWYNDAQGKNCFINQYFLDFTGKSAEQIRGEGWHDLVHPDDAEHYIVDYLVAVHEQRSWHNRNRIRRHDGVWRWHDNYAQPLFSTNGIYLGHVGVTIDNTEAIEAGIALQESEQRYRHLVELTPHLVWNADEQGHNTYVSPQMSAYLGLPPEQLLNLDWETVIHPEDVDRVHRTWMKAVQTGTPYEVEYRLRRVDGEYRWHLVRAVFEGNEQDRKWFGVSTDIHDRKRAEIALRESEAKYRSLFDSIDEGFCLLEMIYDEADKAVDFRLLEVNQVFERQTGLQNTAGKLGSEVVPNTESHWLRGYSNVAQTGEPLRVENYHEYTGRWYSAYGSRVGGVGSRRVAIVFDDITERKRAEEALRESKEQQAFLLKFSDALRAEPDADAVANRAIRMLSEQLRLDRCYIGVYRLADDRADFTHQVGNDRVPPLPDGVRLSDFPEALRVAFDRTLVIDDVAETEGLTDTDRRNLGALGLRALVAATLRKGENNPLWAMVAVSACPRRWTRSEVALAEDVTERTWAAMERARAEEALRASESRYRYLVEAVPHLVWTTDAKGRVTFVSQRLCDYIGLQASQLMNLEWRMVIYPEDVERVYQCWMHSVHTGLPFEAEYRIHRADGTYRWQLSRAMPFRNEQGEVVQWFGLTLDIHDKQELERQRDQVLQQAQVAQEEAERANRIKDEFLSILSHELRSPLNPILGWAQLLQIKTLDQTTTKQALATIEHNAKLQTQLVDDLLDVARILRGKLSLQEAPVNLVSVIAAALEVVKTAADVKSVTLQPELTDIGQVRGDEARLQQIVWNLLSNAIKFTPTGGRVTIRLEQVEDQAQITVTDTGIGIQPQFLPHIFESFRQQDTSISRQYGGLGLGLSIVKYLVEAHGGTITAESPGENQGATFTVQLPLLKAASPSPAGEPRLPGDIDLAGLKVLSVDDREDARELFATVLSLYGAEARVAASGMEALDLLTTFKPDVLICDIGMPGMDGYTLLQRIRALPIEQGGTVPAIAVTAHAREEDQQRALESGFQGHIAKPIEPKRLAIAVAELARTS